MWAWLLAQGVSLGVEAGVGVEVAVRVNVSMAGLVGIVGIPEVEVVAWWA